MAIKKKHKFFRLSKNHKTIFFFFYLFYQLSTKKKQAKGKRP
jgi:hypothetical protein